MGSEGSKRVKSFDMQLNLVFFIIFMLHMWKSSLFMGTGTDFHLKGGSNKVVKNLYDPKPSDNLVINLGSKLLT